MGYKEEYNKEPVHYCVACLSLSVKRIDDLNMDVCMECGNTIFENANIDDWNKRYVDLYGNAFLNTEELDEKY